MVPKIRALYKILKKILFYSIHLLPQGLGIYSQTDREYMTLVTRYEIKKYLR
jgi:hypothetical protein